MHRALPGGTVDRGDGREARPADVLLRGDGGRRLEDGGWRIELGERLGQGHQDGVGRRDRGFGGGPGITFTVNISNLTNRVNNSQPVGNLTSTDFGKSKGLAGFFMGFGPGGGGGGGADAGNRRIELMARINF